MHRFARYFLMLRLFLTGNPYKRASVLKKHFGAIGEHCYMQPINYGTEPYLIYLGNNVHIASKVTFVNHDVINFMLDYKDKGKSYTQKTGKIKVGDNVFIGCNTTILYDVEIGNNVIIGAGSLVCKNIPENSVAAGVPCRVIDSFENFVKKRGGVYSHSNSAEK